MSRLNPWKIQGYKPGQNVICKIAKAEPGGYAVIIPKDNLPGYLPSNARHNVGDEVLATFVCIDKNRMLLSERFTHGKGDPGKRQQSGPNWEEHLGEIDSNYTTGGQTAVPAPDSMDAFGNANYMTGPLPAQTAPDQYGMAPEAFPSAPDQYGAQPDHFGAPPDQSSSGGHPSQQFATGPLPQQQQQQHAQDFNQQQYATGPLPAQMNPQEQLQRQMQGEEARGFQSQVAKQEQYLTGAQPTQRYAEGVPTRRFQLRRAIDLIMPPIEEDTLRSMRIGDYDVEWLITQLEGGMHTGCVKAACESRLSRAAMLLYKGRAVGCIYGCKTDPTTKPTEESLHAMLADLESPDTMVTLYDLPEEITLAMSSLFLGYPVERHDDYSAKEYLDYICNWLGQKNGTATLAISLTEDRGTCLGYIYKGEFAGSFYVEDQAFRADRAFVDELLGNDPRAALEVSILPPEMHASAVRFGFSLSMARTRKLE